MAAVGVVGGRTSLGGGEIALAISLACTIRLSAHHRRFSLHGFDVGVGALVVGAALRIHQADNIASPPRTRPGGLTQANENWAATRWRHARSWAGCPGLAGIARLRPRFRAGIASPLRSLAMARPVECMAWLDPAIVDGELVEFFVAVVPHGATELACGLVPPAALLTGFLVNGRALLKKIRWEMALLLVVFILAMIPTAGVFRWSFRWLPLFHLVLALCAAEALAFFSQKQRRLAAFLMLLLVIMLIIGACVLRTRGEHLFPLAWIFLGLALGWLMVESLQLSFLREWAPAAVVFAALLATYICIPPNSGVPKYNLAQSLLEQQPLDPHRLYLSVYPTPATFYRVEAKPGPVGQIVRLGSTSMWAGLRFVNGYSPIRPAGVAREFASAIHGDVDPDLAQWFLQHQAGENGLLERIGIDGIIVAREFNFTPQPAAEWELATEADEGRVFHRRGQPIPMVRSVNFSGKNSIAKITDIVAGRNYVSASVVAPDGDRPALIAVSRPFFPGYRAQIDRRNLTVFSERNLIPLIDVPPGTHGRLILYYRPNWMIYGSALAITSAAVWFIAIFFAIRRPIRSPK